MVQQIRRITPVRFPLEASFRIEELDGEVIEEIEPWELIGLPMLSWPFTALMAAL